MKADTADIAIIGGGLVGLAMALALKNFSGKVALIESTPPERQVKHEYDARSIALAHGNRYFLEQIGVWPLIADRVNPISTIHISDKGHFGKSRLTAASEQVPALGYVIEIPDLYHALLQAVSACDHVLHCCPAQVAGMSRNGHTWVLQVIDASQAPLNLTTPCVIAADGVKSRVREWLGVNSHEIDYQQQALITNVSLDRAHEQIAYERFTRDGPMALLPLSDQRATLIWTQPSLSGPDMMEWSDQIFLARLQKAFGFYAGRFTQVGRRCVYPLKSTWVSEQVQTGCVFIGNAAHTLHPIAGQGFNLSLQDIKILANLLSQSKEIDQELLDSYYRQRKSYQQRLIQLTDVMVNTFSTSFTPLAKARNMALTFLGHSRITKHLFTHYMMGL